MKLVFSTLSLLVVAAALAQTSPSPITKVGDVYLTRTSIQMPGLPARDSTTVTASFFRATASPAASSGQEACVVVEGGDGLLGLPEAAFENVKAEEPVFLDAGTPLTLRANAGDWTRLERVREGARISYTSAASTLATPPARLVLNVPGAANGFPAFENVAVPASEPPRVTSPTPEEDVTLDTTFAWSDPTREPGATVMLMVMHDEPELVVSCIARDDGTFSFPAATVAELRAKGFENGALTTVGRTTIRTYRSQDAVLSVRAFVLALGER